ncbi:MULTISPECIES: ABC transporter permease [Actibacterium]|uniref:Putative ABC transport system permease protein n=1 Tax=Actibacterium naphthalenivorans TaxID=1614693 RepID=A0A840CBN5_9RHOB|nr:MULTISPECIES: FtsX-like permease family protein [Actibacterium]ALG91071.1 ABC transporter permease [Actibacterium sp. EMB200-NS6]MBB4023474.1 putative ABC transport system permease protein [Actibacterium naphthalenivorans]
MYRAALLALLSHWRRQPLQLASVLVGLALATALWSGVQAINGQARASYDRAAGMLGQDRLPQLVAEDGQRFSQDVYVALRRGGWRISPVLEGQWRQGETRLRVIGIDPVTAPQTPGGGGAAQADGDLRAFLTPPGIAFGAAETIAALQDVPGLPALRVADDSLPGTLIMDIGIAQTLLAAPGQVSRLIVLPDQPLRQTPLQDVAPGLTRRAPQAEADIARLTDSFHLNLTAFGLLSFAVGLFIVHAAIGLAFEQRRAMFRTLRALGLPLVALTRLLVAEVLILSILAGLAGMALGYLVAAALLPDVAATLRGLYGAEVPGTLILRPGWWAGGMAMAVLGAGAAAAQSLWRVWRLPLLAPAQPRAWVRATTRSLWRQVAIAGALALVALGAARFGTGLLAGFILLGALLMAAALALPAVLAALLAGAARAGRGVLARWFWADTRQQLPGLSLALMALLLALAANIGVGTMVASFRLTFAGWLDQRLSAELYVSAETEEQAARLRAWLATRPGDLLPLWSVEVPLFGAPATVQGIADHPTYRRNWPMLSALPDVWGRVASGEGALINEQLARREGLVPGDPLILPDGGRMIIAGVYSDYGNPRGQVMIAVDRLTALFPDVARLRHAVSIAPESAPVLAHALIDDFGLPEDNVSDQAAIKVFSMGIFEQTFAVTAALNILTLGVAGFAILTSLLTLSAMRLPQLAPVWALGLTRARLAWLELARALMLTALTMLVALPVGLLLAWALLAVVNVAAFGWRLPMHVFPADWLRLGALALLAGGLAAAWPAWRLARTAPADLLKVFAHER